MNTATPPSLAQLYPALPCGPKFMGLCTAHLSMSKLFGFADVSGQLQVIDTKGFMFHPR